MSTLKTPYFSIIIPTYNRAHMLPVAINSILEQTFSDWELLIVNDGSKDNTQQVVEQFHDERIKYYYQENQERCVARNNGIDRAQGKYICFLDSDDFYTNNRLKLLYDAIRQNSEPIAMFYTGICFKSDLQIIRRNELLRKDFDNDYDFIVKSIIFCQQSCLHREILRKHKFNPQFRIGEDMELWLRVVNEYDLIYLSEQDTVVVLIHEGRSVNVKNDNVYREVIRVFEYSKKHFHYPFTRKVSNEVYSECYLGIAKYFIYKKKKIKAINYLILSILSDLRSKQLKYKLNIIINIFFNFTKALDLIK